MKRDLQLDSLRGFFLVIMALDHMTVLIFRNYIYQTVVFFTAADGFIFSFRIHIWPGVFQVQG